MMKILLFLCLYIGSVAHSQTAGLLEKSPNFAESKTQITLKSAFSSPAGWGHYPVTVTLRNDSDTTQTFKLNAECVSEEESWAKGRRVDYTKTKSNFNFSCPAGTEKSFDITIPLVTARFSDNYSYDFDCRTVLTLKFENGEEKYTASIVGDYGEITSAYTEGLASIAGGENLTFDIEQFPQSLKGTEGYDALVVLADELRQLPEARLKAIKRWVSRGGVFVIVHNQSNTKHHKSIHKFFPNMKFEGDANLSSAYNNLGQVWVMKEDFLYRFPEKLIDGVDSKLNRNVLTTEFTHSSSWPVQEAVGKKSFGVLAIGLLLIAFTLIVGPLNFFVFAKQGRRHRLFFTTPLISIGMAIILVCFITLKDGFGGKGKQVVLKEVDQEANTSYVVQEQFCRTGMLFSSSFELDNDLMINQVPIEDSRWSRVSYYKRSSEDYLINKGESKSSHSGSYFASRSEHGHVISGTQITQEALTIEPSGDSYEVLSTFKENINTVYFNKGGKYYTAVNLTTGNGVLAQEVEKREWALWLADQKDRFIETNKIALNKYASRENSYVAAVNDATGIESNLSISWDTEMVITGKFNTITSH